jgi:osmotically-inducible protein OsmY
MSTEHAIRRDWRWWASVAAAGAGALALGYLFDREQGRARRQRLFGRSAHFVRRTAHRARREARYLQDTAVKRVEQRMWPLPPKTVEGTTLLDRVESELFADSSIPHGLLNLEARGNVIVLRGQLPSEATIADVEQSVRRIPGVSGVKNLLHVTGTPAPNKVAALRASAKASSAGQWPAEPPPDVDQEAGG